MSLAVVFAKEQSGGAPEPDRARRGRPTRKQAEERFAQLLDTALVMFLERGFELTTVDQIAAAMQMTKRTVYAKFPGKAALFMASVERAIARQTLSNDVLRGCIRDNLAQTLVAIGRLRVGQIMTADGLRLQNVLQAERYRFPEIFTRYYEQSTQPVIAFVAGLLSQAMASGEIGPTNPFRAATAYMSMVVGGPVRAIVAGMPPDISEIEAGIDFSVDLLLNGLRARRAES